MQKLLSSLAYWCPLVSQVDYLPYAFLPFAKVISDELLLFEISMSFIVHWMQCWFEYYPAEPVLIVTSVE